MFIKLFLLSIMSSLFTYHIIIFIITRHDLDKLVLRYKKEYIILIDVAGDGDCLHRSIIKSDTIPCSDHIFRSEDFLN